MATNGEEMETSQGQVEDDDNDDDNGDASDDSSDDQIDDDKQDAELATLNAKVQENPFNYQSHIDYINLAREYGNLDHLRSARQKMSEVFPLTEQLWLDWLGDEQKLLTTDVTKKQELVELFERAVNDYLSVMIWIEYVQYRLSLDLSSNAIEELRDLFERGLSSCAVHLPNGSLFWAAYIEVEQAKLLALSSNFNENSSDDIREKLLQQVDFILKLYRRQLSIPLRRMQSVYDEYNEFCQQFKPFLPTNYAEQHDLPLKRDFDQAIGQLQRCEQFEKELDETTRSVEIYKRYIDSEREPARIQCLYERAIVDNCLDGQLWLAYLDFAEEYLPSTSHLKSIHERSLRNCPWVGALWIRYAEFMELNQSADHAQLKGIYDRGINSDPTNLAMFVTLQLAYLQYRRRHFEHEVLSKNVEQCEILKGEIRHACESACDQYQEMFLTSTDPKLFLKYNGQLELLWIHFEVKHFQSLERARQIWNGRTLMSKSHNQLISNLWKNYYYMENHYGDDKHARKVLYRALAHVQSMDFPLIICDLLLEHENKYGTIEQIREAKDRVRQVKKKITPVEKPRRQPAGAASSSVTKKKPAPNQKPAKPDVKKTNAAQQPLPASSNNHEGQQPSSPRKRKLSLEETQNGKKKQSTTGVDNEGFKVPLPPQAATTASSARPTLAAGPVTNNTDHLNTVFIANLSYDADEDAIRTALSVAGPIKDIRIVKHEWSGKSKGFCYVDFENAEGYRQALKLDHTPINGRPMYISPYDANKSASNDMTKKFKYATSLEQNKLFLSNLPFSATKEAIENLFTQHQFKIKDIRMVTHKSGKFKGLAYAEFIDAHEASQAILKLDGFDMDGHAIKVALSNPPQKKEQQKTTAPRANAMGSQVASLGAAPKSAGPRGKGYSQISLVPRKVAPAAAAPREEATNTPNGMSNDAFRQMFLSKK